MKKKWNGYKDKGVQHLAYQDLLDIRKKGLCFKCSGHYRPMHQCPIKQLRVIIINDEILMTCDEKEPEVEASVVEEKEETNGVCNALNLKVLGVESKEVSKTLKINGRVGEFPFFILVDNEASHNFISESLLKLWVASGKIPRTWRFYSGTDIFRRVVVFVKDSQLN